MGIPPLPAELLLDVAPTLQIKQKRDGSLSPWVPNDEQIKAMRLVGMLWVIFAKPRQIGLSTVICFIDVMWAWWRDLHGHPGRCGIVIDTDAKATERINVCESFAKQLGLRAKRFAASSRGPERLVFPGGSEIVAFSAGGNRAGSSMSFDRFHFTELPYWRNATTVYGSLMPALAEDGECIVETTMDVTDDPLAKNLWKKRNAYEKVFFSVEDHASFRRSADEITDEEWEAYQEEGFTIREAAAWFRWAVSAHAGDDESHAFHLYPQLPKHLFQMGAHRFIKASPRVVEPLRRVQVAGREQQPWLLEVFKEPADTSGQLVIAVDTSQGKEHDRSAVAVIDKEGPRLCASFVSDTVWQDDLAHVAHVAQQLYTLPVLDAFGERVRDNTPEIIVEDNGIGDATLKQLRRRAAISRKVTTTQASKLEGLLAAKRHIEAGHIWGPASLDEECDSLYRNEKGQFKGKKDLIMTIGFCMNERTVNPFRPAPEPEPTDRFFWKRRIRRESKRGGGVLGI